jgi:hypothetical protein
MDKLLEAKVTIPPNKVEMPPKVSLTEGLEGSLKLYYGDMSPELSNVENYGYEIILETDLFTVDPRITTDCDMNGNVISVTGNGYLESENTARGLFDQIAGQLKRGEYVIRRKRSNNECVRGDAPFFIQLGSQFIDVSYH